MKTNTPAPAFNVGLSALVSPYRHESGRTVARHQPAENKAETHLFSATGLFIATVATAAANAAAEKAAAEAKAATAAAIAANNKLHAERTAPAQ
jgi:hypothetical protein